MVLSYFLKPIISFTFRTFSLLPIIGLGSSDKFLWALDCGVGREWVTHTIFTVTGGPMGSGCIWQEWARAQFCL